MYEHHDEVRLYLLRHDEQHADLLLLNEIVAPAPGLGSRGIKSHAHSQMRSGRCLARSVE